MAEEQSTFKVDASVWDASHHTHRGYGTIVGTADAAEDSTPRWRVCFDAGHRVTAIKETSLDLCIMRHQLRQEASGIGQRILVVSGSWKGMEGVTVRKVSMHARRQACIAPLPGWSQPL